jgi:hypothetical protein
MAEISGGVKLCVAEDTNQTTGEWCSHLIIYKGKLSSQKKVTWELHELYHANCLLLTVKKKIILKLCT